VASAFGIRPKICRPAAAEESSRTQEKKTSATQGKMGTMGKMARTDVNRGYDLRQG